jgi:mannitol 2-dehydrogenase/sorbose reductase
MEVPMMNTTPLSSATLDALQLHNPELALPGYDRSKLTAGIAHIGVGNFHRVHQAAYIDQCLHMPGHEDWAIIGIGLGDSEQAQAKAAAFALQDGLYTVTETGADGSANARVIGAMIDYLHAPADPEAVLRCLSDPAIRIVTLTITEGGYNLNEATGEFRLTAPDIAAELGGGAPRSAFAYLVESLRRRRDNGSGGYTVVSCDNLRHNGDTARLAVLSYAQAVDAELADWIATEVTFPNSMVDRIAPGIPADQADALNSASGVNDQMPALAEPYTQWVIEDRFSAGRPDLAAAGVELLNDVTQHEAIKGRMLNASHMMLAYPGLLLGYRTVPEAMADDDLRQLLHNFMEHDAMPLLDEPEGLVLEDYKNSVLERFNNPAIADQLTRVAHDGAAKIPVFYTATVKGMLSRGFNCRRVAFLLACFRLYLNGLDARGDRYDVNEPRLSNADWSLVRNGPPSAVLDLSCFRGMKLTQHARMVTTYNSLWMAVTRSGVRATLQSLMK